MADGSRMMLCVMVLTVLAFNPLASLSPAPPPTAVGDVPGRTILEEQPQAGGVYYKSIAEETHPKLTP